MPTPPAAWQSLFNGRDLEGWDGDKRLWSVRDGVIHGETTAEANRRKAWLIDHPAWGSSAGAVSSGSVA